MRDTLHQSDATTTSSRRRLGGYADYLLLAVAYGLTGEVISYLLRNVDSHLWTIAPRLAIPWIPAGIAVAGLILGGRRLWPALFVAAAVIWVHALSLFTGLIEAAGITAGYVTTWHLLGRWNYRRAFDRYQDPLLLLAAAAIGMFVVEVADVVSVLLTAWLYPKAMSADLWRLVRLAGPGVPVPTLDFLRTAGRWWLNDIAGIALVVPAAVSGSPGLWRSLWSQRFELATLGLAAIAWAIGALTVPYGEARPAMLLGALALVTWSAVRFGVTVASTATLAFSMVVAVGFLCQIGPLATISPSEGVAALWMVIAILAGTSLFLTALLAERERVNAALRQSEERLLQALRVSHIGIYDHDQITERIYWSPEQRRNYGFSDDEPVTLSAFLACVHPDDRASIAVAVARAHDPTGDGLFDVEHRIIRRDGAVRWLITRSRTFFEGTGRDRRAVRTVGGVLDVTDRRRAEEALRASEARLAEAQRLGSMGSWELDRVARRLVISTQAGHIFEVDPDVGHPPEAFLQIVHPEDRDMLTTAVREYLEDQQHESELTIRLQMADERVKFITARWETTRDAAGSVITLIGTVQDITERKRLERAVVDAAADERQRLASELHDNLGQILFSTSLMLGSFKKDVAAAAPALTTSVDGIVAALSEALGVCRHLAHTAVPVVEGGLGEALLALATRSSTTGVRCVVRASPTAVMAASPAQALELYRIAQEAITNALKHSNCRQIEVDLLRRGATLELVIGDDGVGIAPPAHPATEGMGLRTMRFRAERAGGAVQIERRPDGGTVVRVRMPGFGQPVGSAQDHPGDGAGRPNPESVKGGRSGPSSS